MDETNAVSPDPIIETPVEDTSLFLLDKCNHDFLNGTRTRAYVEESYRVSGLFVLLVVAIVIFVI